MALDRWLTTTVRRLRAAQELARESAKFSAVTLDVIPVSPGGDLVMSISLLAQLREPIDANKRALGIELDLRRAGEEWMLDAELGWSGRDIGWDNFEDRRAVGRLEDVLEASGPMVEWLCARFIEYGPTLDAMRHGLDALRRVLRDDDPQRNAVYRELRAAVEQGAIDACTEPRLNLPASQLAASFRTRRDNERQRPAPLWEGLDELVDALEGLSDERPYSFSALTHRHDYLVFITETHCVGVARRPLRSRGAIHE